MEKPSEEIMEYACPAWFLWKNSRPYKLFIQHHNCKIDPCEHFVRCQDYTMRSLCWAAFDKWQADPPGMDFWQARRKAVYGDVVYRADCAYKYRMIADAWQQKKLDREWMPLTGFTSSDIEATDWHVHTPPAVCQHCGQKKRSE